MPPSASSPKGRTRFVVLTMIFALVLFHPPAARGGEPTWLEVQSEHFKVLTDAGEKSGRDVAMHFEQMRAAFGMLFGREKVNQKVPLQIIAFRNTKEMRQYSPWFRGKVIEVAGFFAASDDKDFVIIDMSQPNSWGTVMHEYAHVLLDSNYTPTAPWFDEGFAEFFSTIKVNGAQLEVGDVIPGSDVLLQGKRLGLLDLLQVEHHSETYNQSGERRDMFYYQSWLLVHYLFDTEQISKAARYFTLVNNRKMPVPEAVQQAFGMSVDQLDKVLTDYLRANKIRQIRYTYGEKVATSTSATVRPATSLEAHIQLADLLLREEERAPQGLKELEAIVAADPQQPEAQRALGYGYLRDRNFSKASEHLQAAAASGSNDARVYYFSAMVMAQQDSGSMSSLKVIENLKRAVAIDPNFAPAYAMLGVSQLNGGHYMEAETALARAIALSPRDEVSRLNYAFALLNQQKIDQAKVAINNVVTSKNPELASEAADLLRRVKEYEDNMAAAVGRNSDDPGPSSSGLAVRAPSGASPSLPSTEEAPPPVPPGSVTMSYLKGTLVKVDCSSPPLARLTVTASGKTWNLTTPNTDKMVLIGADKFSCSWSNQKVAINFTPTKGDEGKVVSLEIQ